MTFGVLRTWAWIHRWSSLVCTVFLAMLCLTGLPLIFHEEIDAATTPRASLAALPADAPMLSLDAIVARAVAKQPGEVPIYLSFDTDRPVVNVTTGPTPDAAAADMHFMPMDWRTGDFVAAPPAGGLTDFLLTLHTDMFLGVPGMLSLGLMGLLFVIAIVSGVVIYAPYMVKLEFGVVRKSRRARVRWTDYHKLLGVVTLAWAIVVGGTGVINTLSGQITDLWKADQLGAMVGERRGAPAYGGPVAVQAALDAAHRAAPGMNPQFMAFPGSPFSSSGDIAVFMQGATAATEKLLTPVLADARTGALTAARPMPWYMQALFLSQPLHFGAYGGLAMKLIWAALDLITLIVLGSGVYLWACKGRKAAA